MRKAPEKSGRFTISQRPDSGMSSVVNIIVALAPHRGTCEAFCDRFTVS